MEPNVFDNLVRQFGARVGLPDMKLDDSGLCRVVLDETVNLDFELSSDCQTLYLYSALPPMDNNVEVDLMKALLTANYGLHRSCQFRFAYDENAHEFLLLETIPAKGIDLETFDQILQNFARTATTWHSNCRKGELGGSSSQSGSEGSEEGGDRHLPFV